MSHCKKVTLIWGKPKSKYQSKRSTSLLMNSGENNKRRTSERKLKNQYEILTDKNHEFASSSSEPSLTTKQTISPKTQKELAIEDQKRNQ